MSDRKHGLTWTMYGQYFKTASIKFMITIAIEEYIS